MISQASQTKHHDAQIHVTVDIHHYLPFGDDSVRLGSLVLLGDGDGDNELFLNPLTDVSLVLDLREGLFECVISVLSPLVGLTLSPGTTLGADVVDGPTTMLTRSRALTSSCSDDDLRTGALTCPPCVCVCVTWGGGLCSDSDLGLGVPPSSAGLVTLRRFIGRSSDDSGRSGCFLACWLVTMCLRNSCSSGEPSLTTLTLSNT